MGLSDDVDQDEAEVTVRIDLRPLTDTVGMARGEIPRTILAADGRLLAGKDDKDVRIILAKGARTQLLAEADCHPDWRARWEIRAQRTGS